MRVTICDVNILRRQAEFTGNDLGDRRLMPLAVRRVAFGHLDLAVRVELDRCHAKAGLAFHGDQDLRGNTGNFHPHAEADTQITSVLPRLGLLLPKIVVIQHGARLGKRAGKVSRVYVYANR